jgi:hypothetical protein
MRAVRRLFDGTGPYSGIALGAFLAGSAMLLAILLSPHGWQWWLDAHQVHGREQAGTVYYSFEGRNGTVDDVHSETRTGLRDVYVIAADPYHGALVNAPTVLLDWSVTAGPGVIGVVLLAYGFIRRSRIRNRQRAVELIGAEQHGYAIPTEVIRNIVSQRDEAGRRGPPTRQQRN